MPDWSETEDLTVSVVLTSEEEESLSVHPPSASGTPAEGTPRAAAAIAAAATCDSAPLPSLGASATGGTAAAATATAAAAASGSAGVAATEEGEEARRAKGGGENTAEGISIDSADARGQGGQGQAGDRAQPMGTGKGAGVGQHVAPDDARIAALESRLLAAYRQSRGAPQAAEHGDEAERGGRGEGGGRRRRGRGAQNWSAEWDLDDDPPEEAIDAALGEPPVCCSLRSASSPSPLLSPIPVSSPRRGGSTNSTARLPLCFCSCGRRGAPAGDASPLARCQGRGGHTGCVTGS